MADPERVLELEFQCTKTQRGHQISKEMLEIHLEISHKKKYSQHQTHRWALIDGKESQAQKVSPFTTRDKVIPLQGILCT